MCDVLLVIAIILCFHFFNVSILALSYQSLLFLYFVFVDFVYARHFSFIFFVFEKKNLTSSLLIIHLLWTLISNGMKGSCLAFYSELQICAFAFIHTFLSRKRKLIPLNSYRPHSMLSEYKTLTARTFLYHYLISYQYTEQLFIPKQDQCYRKYTSCCG